MDFNHTRPRLTGGNNTARGLPHRGWAPGSATGFELEHGEFPGLPPVGARGGHYIQTPGYGQTARNGIPAQIYPRSGPPDSTQ